MARTRLRPTRRPDALPQTGLWRRLQSACSLLLVSMLVAHWLPAGGSAALAPGGQSEALDRRHGYALRVVLFVRGSRAVPFETDVTGVTVINPEFVTAQVSGGRTVIF
ncbi:MAG TPA: hypothetical protein VF508_12725, partial [Pyrinomonadaceae bacterium]